MAIVWHYLSLAAQVPLFDLDIVPERLEEKQAYLDTLPKAAETAPNVVVILFDDFGWGDLSRHGNWLIKTPHMDQAAADGLLMTDFYSASPVCTPSCAAGGNPQQSHLVRV